MKITKYTVTCIDLEPYDIQRYVAEGLLREHGLQVRHVHFRVETVTDAVGFESFEDHVLSGAYAEIKEPIEDLVPARPLTPEEVEKAELPRDRAGARRECDGGSGWTLRPPREIVFESPEVEERFRVMQQRRQEGE